MKKTIIAAALVFWAGVLSSQVKTTKSADTQNTQQKIIPSTDRKDLATAD